MQNREIKVKCYSCGQSFTTDNMRHDPNKPGRLVCRNCLAKKDKRETTEYDYKPKQGEESIKYYCIKCKYKFVRRKSAAVTACPYCGGEGTLTTKADASSLLKSADSDFFE
ncbi:MAG: hypothetical protein ABIG95_06435 [Candidatus Woesearchaeota archaeon]